MRISWADSPKGEREMRLKRLLVFSALLLVGLFVSQEKTCARGFVEVGEGGLLTAHRLYVLGLGDYSVVQQPADEEYFVSQDRCEVAEFREAEDYGVVWLLAHSHLAGGNFSDLDVGEKVFVEFDDEVIRSYSVVEIRRYRKLETVSSNAYDGLLVDGQQEVSIVQVMKEFVAMENYLILQTCIYGDDDRWWGFLFVVAEPDD